ncbi:hypothetical protein [Streptomyces sp. NPDC006012]|uniref:hypothetical protein n=1 Tax=Streptomyces sp. NPDC006012 TaxID=3364739 RepID=UPI0036C056C8
MSHRAGPATGTVLLPSAAVCRTVRDHRAVRHIPRRHAGPSMPCTLPCTQVTHTRRAHVSAAPPAHLASDVRPAAV